MDTDYRTGMVDFLKKQDFRNFTTLAFNRDISTAGARAYLGKLHARLDRAALGCSWSKKRIDERMFSISFIENPETNLHFHMLWRSPCFETMLIDKMPGFWEKLVPAGNVDTQPISNIDPLTFYCTKQLRQDSYILSSEFSSVYATPT